MPLLTLLPNLDMGGSPVEVLVDPGLGLTGGGGAKTRTDDGGTWEYVKGKGWVRRHKLRVGSLTRHELAKIAEAEHFLRETLLPPAPVVEPVALPEPEAPDLAPILVGEPPPIPRDWQAEVRAHLSRLANRREQSVQWQRQTVRRVLDELETFGRDASPAVFQLGLRALRGPVALPVEEQARWRERLLSALAGVVLAESAR